MTHELNDKISVLTVHHQLDDFNVRAAFNIIVGRSPFLAPSDEAPVTKPKVKGVAGGIEALQPHFKKTPPTTIRRE